jgi:nucleoside-diphosphate-sugar epimerase
MRILVTGATGCLGGVAAAKLAALGHSVTGTGRDLAKGAALATSGVTFTPAELTNQVLMRALVLQHDVVIHCGGLSSPWGKDIDFQRSNVDGTRILVEAALEGSQRLVFVSSPSIYFDFSDRIAIGDNDPPAPQPVNAYAASKLAAEEIVTHAAANGLDAVILRPRAIFGATDTALLPRLLKAAARGYLPLIDDGKAAIDLTYVDNAADALIAAALRPQRFAGQAYNISNGEPITVRDLLQRIAGGLGLRVRFVDLPFAVAYRVAAILETLAKLRPSRSEPMLTRYAVGVLAKSQTLSIAGAARDLGFKPAVSLDEGLRRTLAAWKARHA